jgi:hypothetical protein
VATNISQHPELFSELPSVSFQSGLVLAAPYFDKQRLVTVNTVAKKFSIICCVTGLLGTSVASASAASLISAAFDPGR